jgi:hypothetical protein
MLATTSLMVLGSPPSCPPARRIRGAFPAGEPALHVGDEGLEVVEPTEPHLDSPEVDIRVLVDENVPEGCRTLQPLRGLRRDDPAREQPGRDLPVLVDRFLKVPCQDVAACVEEGFGGHVETMRHRPPEHQVLLETIAGHR